MPCHVNSEYSTTVNQVHKKDILHTEILRALLLVKTYLEFFFQEIFPPHVSKRPLYITDSKTFHFCIYSKYISVGTFYFYKELNRYFCSSMFFFPPQVICTVFL